MPAANAWHIVLYPLTTPLRKSPMCGIVHTPTRSKTFPRNGYSHLSDETIRQVILVCEETHIPEEATRIVLLLANFAVTEAERARVSLPFALYRDGMRYITEETIRAEQAIIHLAMAGSTRYHINMTLRSYGIALEMGHCCTIEMHRVDRAEEAMTLSHDDNMYRADRLRNLNGESTLPPEKFLALITDPPLRELAKVVFGHKVFA